MHNSDKSSGLELYAQVMGSFTMRQEGYGGWEAKASGWESEGLGLIPQRLQATFEPGLPKNNKLFPA